MEKLGPSAQGDLRVPVRVGHHIATAVGRAVFDTVRKDVVPKKAANEKSLSALVTRPRTALRIHTLGLGMSLEVGAVHKHGATHAALESLWLRPHRRTMIDPAANGMQLGHLLAVIRQDVLLNRGTASLKIA